MSEKFGLDWRSYDNKRMMEFVEMIKYDNERQEKEINKHKSKSKYGK